MDWMWDLPSVPEPVLRRALLAVAATATLTAAVLAFGATSALAAPGQLDTSFGSNGVVFGQFGAATPAKSWSDDVVADPEGRLYIGGQTINASGNQEIFVARYLASGALDPSFGAGGVVLEQLGTGSTPSSGGSSGLLRLALTPDGRLVVATSANYGASNYNEVAVMRLTSAGQLDGTFGVGGVVRQQLGTYSTPSSQAVGVAVQPDGNIVITGQEKDSSGNQVFFAERLLSSNGQPDPAFASGGLYERQLALGGTPKTSDGTDVVVQPDGKLVFSALADDASGNPEFAITRLTTSGAPDPTFGVSYVQASSRPSSAASEPFRVRMQSNGDLVLAGLGYDSAGNGEYALARFTPTGLLDTSFGPSGTGLFLRQLSATGNSAAYGLAVQGNDRLVAIGGFQTGTTTADGALIRLTSNGTLDSSFGGTGVVDQQFSTSSGTPATGPLGGAITPDGQLVDTGIIATPTSGEYKTFLARVLLDSPPSVSFSYSPAAPATGQPVTFTAGASDDTTVSSIQWDLGSGSFTDASGLTATRTFSAAGSYTIRVKATDDDGQSSISSQTVTIASPPAFLLGKMMPSPSGVTFSLACRAIPGAVCPGLVQLSTLEKLRGSKILALAARSGKRRSRRVLVGALKLSLTAGRTQKITVPLNRTGKKLLTRFGRLPVTLTLTLLNATPPTVITGRTTIKPKAKAKHNHAAADAPPRPDLGSPGRDHGY